MGHGKGAIPMRKIERTLKANGYTFVRNNGHMIWENDNGNSVAILKTCCTYLVKRIFKENGIEWKE